ncbi:sensor histidine kinase [Microvirga alba]|uniref:Blue-light-activated histidine kinase n=1 Tax=Microvirga alba TaxID=2791025 RepID=A0A931BKL1_9HYPH|nr:HWE histidine kinase domain-containing protein [Microvirga alba]MBF9232707.1 PAS domain-containing protein [Microvirga alba]
MSPFQEWASGLNEFRFQAGAQDFGPDALTQLLEHVPLALAVTLGSDHRCVFANRLFRSAFSTRDSDFIGKTVSEIIGDRYAAGIATCQARVFETGETYEISGAPFDFIPNRETTYWDIKLVPTRGGDDRISGVLIIGANVTDRVKARAEADRQAHHEALHHERLALAAEATELGLWEWDVRTGQTYWSERQKEIFGLPIDQPATYDVWLSSLHPEDRDQVLKCVTSLLDPNSDGRLQLEHRITRPDDETRWIIARGRMMYDVVKGVRVPSRLLGTILDITERRKGEETRQLLVQELNHRVKNLFAMASGMVALTAKTAQTPRDMSVVLRGRLQALARAHELIRPAITGDEPAGRETSIDEIVRVVLAPHIDQETQMSIDGTLFPVGPRAATSLTLVLHELATNASKYGALSVHEGQVQISWTHDDSTLLLLWQETNGPRIATAPAAEGFGSQLARTSVTGQLGGDIHYDWRSEGLHVRIRLPLDFLSH